MRNIIAWFVDNPVAANLLMLIIMGAGLLGISAVHREEFPELEVPAISITVPYLGAAPAEVESGVCLRIEEAIQGIVGIKRIKTTAKQGLCTTLAELETRADANKALDDIKAQVNAIPSLPKSTERPIVTKITVQSMVMQIAIAGKTTERVLKQLADEVRNELLELPEISHVDTLYRREDEISVEVSEVTLREHGLSFASIARAIDRASVDIPGGSIKSPTGEVLLRSNGQRYSAAELEDVPVLSRSDGTQLELGSIARLRDGFEQTDISANFDGAPAMLLQISRVGTDDTVEIARAAKAYISRKQQQLPENIVLDIWRDESNDLTIRLRVLINNALGGMALVVLTLALFLKTRLALWVSMGIPISILGALAMFPAVGLSISTLSLVGFLLSLGILVDDAIVVGERIHAHERMAMSGRDAAIEGTHQVAVPVFFGVLTTMAAFIPVVSVEDSMGEFLKAIGITLILCLAFSLIESQLILPSHLAHRKRERKQGTISRRWERLQERLSAGLDALAEGPYQRLLRQAVCYRYITSALALAAFILILGLMSSGRIVFQFFPSVPGDDLYARVVLPEGAPLAQTLIAAERVIAAGDRMVAELATTTREDIEPLQHTLVSVGMPIARGGLNLNVGEGSHVAEIGISLLPWRERGGLLPEEAVALWREYTGNIPGVMEMSFTASSLSLGADIDIQMRGSDVKVLGQASSELRDILAEYDGLFDINDSYRSGKAELMLKLKPDAAPLGLSQADIGEQVRRAFYGEEVQRFQRGRDDVRIMVRYPESERESMASLEQMRIRLPDGTEVPLLSVADLTFGEGESTILRVDGQRVVNVTAAANRNQVSPEAIIANLFAVQIPELQQRYPGVTFTVAGEAEERASAVAGLFRMSLVALMVIFALLAIPLRSYLQPLVVMASIPFGMIGAILGHYMLGYDLVFFSMLGIVALSGVVINSSLVLVDYVNRQRTLAGVSLEQAVMEAGVSRFRPILLTSATTFIGLAPLMITADQETLLFVPLAVSLGFGVVFATAVTLLLIPALYLVLEDVLGIVGSGKTEHPSP